MRIIINRLKGGLKVSKKIKELSPQQLAEFAIESLDWFGDKVNGAGSLHPLDFIFLALVCGELMVLVSKTESYGCISDDDIQALRIAARGVAREVYATRPDGFKFFRKD